MTTTPTTPTTPISTYQFAGKHYFASYKNCDVEMQNLISLKEAVKEAIFQSGATILDSCEYVFNNTGITIVYLLSESHCSIHTYPEHKSIFVDLFTCGTSCDHDVFHQYLVDYLQPETVVHEIISRE